MLSIRGVSRFRPGGEREYVFAACDKPKVWDWLSLYHQTNSVRISSALENKKRVWHLINILKQMTDLEWSGDSTLLLPSYQSRLESWDWSQVPCSLMDSSPRPQPESDPSVEAQITSLPSHISQVGVSIIYDGEESYVGGMQFVSPDNERLYLGYIMKENTSFVDVDCVKGFKLSVGMRGIHALQVIGDNSQSPWLGCPDMGLKTGRLVFQDQIEVLKATFDGFKLLHLQAWGKKTPVPPELRRRDFIMNHQMWYPDIPRPTMHVNESCFVGDLEITHPFQPMTYAHFGGPGGAYLPFLTRMSVFFCHDDERKITPMISVAFTYNAHAPTMPLSSQKLWPCPFPNVIRRIVSTNWGRTCEFVPAVDYFFTSPEPAISDAEVTLVPDTASSHDYYPGRMLPSPEGLWYMYSNAEIAPGTVPTGFYACLDHSPERRTSVDCFKGFGIISESVGGLVDKKARRLPPPLNTTNKRRLLQRVWDYFGVSGGSGR
ncbi:hypothetical protein FQN50_002342 [Emmonsiellopsis sp. PD_5]|nr:hypothetical protein FQN50_002342 [Emmonsiellopsis sp. PD_5]